uniref:Uncharacterized protein n=3 Tax=Glossina TaxID=44049 RepID=A0A1B0AD93_GLOPL
MPEMRKNPKKVVNTQLILPGYDFSLSNQSKISDDFFQMSERCMRLEKVPDRYKAQFTEFQFPNDPIVHKYILCVNRELQIWDNNQGFDIEKIYQQYKGRANEEVVLPIISQCNQDAKQRNYELWCYKAFLCILDTQVGEWFKEDVRRQQTRTLTNGHQ